MNHTTTPNNVHTITPSDVTATAAIASTAFASPIIIVTISITGQKTAGVALAATSAAAKAIRLPTKIDGGIDDGGRVATKINQNQAN